MSHNHSPLMPVLRRSPRWLLALALLATLWQSIAGARLPVASIAGGFHAEICTATGLVSPSDTSSGHVGAGHDCCLACAFGAPLLASHAPHAVPPAPTFVHVAESGAVTQPTSSPYLVPPPRAPPQV